jgi:hypothetical protein
MMMISRRSDKAQPSLKAELAFAAKAVMGFIS